MKNFKLLLMYFMLVTQSVAQAKVLIITHAYNRPDFIPLQDITFKMLLKDEYEFVVFNDARNPQFRQQIYDVCKELGLRCIGIPQEIHDRPYLKRLPREDFNHSCCRCANVVQYSLNELGFFHDDIVAIVDSDLFLIKPFSIREYMKGYALAGLDQERKHVHYIWNGLVFFDMPNLPDKNKLDFNCGEVDGIPVDVGGQTYHYLKKHREVRVRYVNEFYPHELKKKSVESLPEFGITQKTMSFITAGFDRSALLLDSTFFHYQSATWDNKGENYHQKKTAMLVECIKQALS